MQSVGEALISGLHRLHWSVMSAVGHYSPSATSTADGINQYGVLISGTNVAAKSGVDDRTAFFYSR